MSANKLVLRNAALNAITTLCKDYTAAKESAEDAINALANEAYKFESELAKAKYQLNQYKLSAGRRITEFSTEELAAELVRRIHAQPVLEADIPF